ncbi:TetR family transcriptional regulator [Massilia arenosa]|uniref:TetR family transcriptional regulator n=1 Tax=Zemynaea arenosa TaxID=2561931 RepID=A0A4Y9SYD1_9BURK|nr:TetR family transcriptional regulator [Massilia arenosa]TFW30224.1 TetR family transcriptional regulator [Massilia arenosa]
MPRQSNSEQRREQITAGLLASIAEHGYDKATIQSIARNAGLSPGLIHYHFKCKEEILLHLVRSLGDAARQRFLSMAEDTRTPAERLTAYINARLDLNSGANPEAAAAWVMIGTEAVRQPEVRRLYQHVMESEIQLVHELVCAVLMAAGRATQHAAQFALTLVTFIEGAFQMTSAARDVMPKGYATTAALAMVEQFVAGEPAARRESNKIRAKPAA